jgi:hypothetical protein
MTSSGGIGGQRSVISPVPAHSRTVLIPSTADALSGNCPETARTVPSGAFNLNLKETPRHGRVRTFQP